MEWVIQGTHKRNFKIAILKINSGSNREDLWQKMQQAGLIYDLEDRKNTLDLSYINFDAKMNYSISYHIIH